MNAAARHPLRVLDVPATGSVDRASLDAADVHVHHRDGNLPPLVMIRTWTESQDHVRHLAARLGPEQPIYSITPPRGEQRDDFPRSFEEWLDFAESRMGVVVSGGAHYLGGWSFGGVVARGLAERLAAKGEKIGLLLLIDAWLPINVPKRDTLEARVRSRIRKAAKRVIEWSEISSAEDRRRFAFRRLTPSILRSKQPAADAGVQGLGAEASARSSRLGEAVVASPSLLKKSVLVGYVKFKPAISTNPIVVFQTEGSRSRIKVGAGLGWSEYQAGDFRCLPTPGSHFTIFDVPNIDVLATNMKRCLAGARAELAAGPIRKP